MTSRSNPDLKALREAVSLAQRRIRQHPQYKSYDVAVGPKWVRAQSVSSLTGVIDKSKYLKKWAAELQFEQDCATFFEKLKSGGISKGMSIDSLRAVLSEQGLAFDNYQKRAKEEGLSLHSLIEGWLKTQASGGKWDIPKGVSDEVLFSFDRWLEWGRKVGLKPLNVEDVTFSPWGDTWVAGRFDLLAYLDGELSDGQPITGLAIVDWKKGARIYDEYRLQSVAMRRCFHEQYGGDPLVGVILKVDDSTGIATIEEEVLHPVNDRAMQIVLEGCLAIARWQSKNRRSS